MGHVQSLLLDTIFSGGLASRNAKRPCIMNVWGCICENVGVWVWVCRYECVDVYVYVCVFVCVCIFDCGCLFSSVWVCGFIYACLYNVLVVVTFGNHLLVLKTQNTKLYLNSIWNERQAGSQESRHEGRYIDRPKIRNATNHLVSVFP